MNHPLLGQAGEKQLLLGNEAIVRGALEAGINIVTCYPGTPSSEVPDTFYRLRACERFVMEYSPNEKVAMEVGLGASLGGALALVTMKHVGVNVAADPLMTATYTGVPGGLVLLSADDPGCHSSQNEQDNRTYARFAQMPCFEPATAQEAKDMTRDALLLARETQQPVMLRTTTRVNHLRGEVNFGALPENGQPLVPFKRDNTRFVTLPATARRRHPVLAANMAAIAETADTSRWNTIKGNGKLGVIASGISRAYLNDAVLEADCAGELSIFELGFSWPLPEKKILEFMGKVEKILVLEELEPLLENNLRALAQKHGINIGITGKGGPLTQFGEYSTPKVAAALAEFRGVKAPAVALNKSLELPQRPPSLCAGCAHRAVFYATRKVFGDNAYYSSDIGCYTLGMMPPLRMADFLFCMGSSISAGSGFARASGDPVVAFIGDSTFFHSGLTGLVNAVFNKHNLIVVILDNGTTAMTGHQPNPGMCQDLLGAEAFHLDIEAVVRGCGVEKIARVKPNNLKQTLRVLEEMKNESGVRVIIAEEPCVLFARRSLKKTRPQKAHVAVQGPETLTVAAEYACPAFNQCEGTLEIDESLCSGCMVCIQISSNFKAGKKESQNV